MKTSIIIMSYYDDCYMTRQCIESIRKYTDENYEIIVIVNNYSNDSYEFLLKQNDIKIVDNSENKGFANGYNKGINIAEGENILFLNNEFIVTQGWLKNMLKLLYRDEKIGMVGPVNNYVKGNQYTIVPNKDMSKIDEFSRHFCYLNSGCFKTVRYLEGFCFLVKKKVLDDIGLFDETIKTQVYEFDDICYRAYNKGYLLKIALDSFVYHADWAKFDKKDTKTKEIYEEDKKKIVEKWGIDIKQFLESSKNQITISLCMIVKNEEKTLGRCLDSVLGVADEIIIVDTGSTDNTKNVALKYTDKIYDFEWINDFSAARNFAFGKATKEYIFWLDADDVMSRDNRDMLIALKNNMDTNVDSVTLNYNLSFDAKGYVMASLRRNRLVRRACHFQWIGAVHEYLAVWGNIINSDIAVEHRSIEHDSDRNLQIYENRLKTGEEFTPRDLFYYANELFDHKKYDKAADYYEKFLNTDQGWIEDNIAACGKLADCYYNLQDTKKGLFYTIKSFEYDIPRAEFCCRMGYYFFMQNKYKEAIFWYKLATELEKPSQSWGLVNNAYRTWLPNLQLCVCYDRLGNHELAYQYNEKAAQYIPDDPKIEYNRKYFKSILNNDKE